MLLRIMCVNEDESDCQGEFDQISISLNRQKPIKGEDIAYTDRLYMRSISCSARTKVMEFISIS